MTGVLNTIMTWGDTGSVLKVLDIQPIFTLHNKMIKIRRWRLNTARAIRIVQLAPHLRLLYYEGIVAVTIIQCFRIGAPIFLFLVSIHQNNYSSKHLVGLQYLPPVSAHGLDQLIDSVMERLSRPKPVLCVGCESMYSLN